METGYCPVCGWELELESLDQVVEACLCCRFHFCEFGDRKQPCNHFDANNFFVRIWRGMWEEAHLKWRGEAHLKPMDWEPIKQMQRIGVHLADSFEEWMAENPVIIPENGDKFLAIVERKIEALGWKPDVIEAMWDGDTQGWFLLIGVSTEESGKAGWGGRTYLLSLRGSGGDIRVFNRNVPPWPESVIGQYVGEAIAAKYGIPFWFPAPEQPNDDYAGWWERDENRRCIVCKRYLGDLAVEYDRETNTKHPKEICYTCELNQRFPKGAQD